MHFIEKPTTTIFLFYVKKRFIIYILYQIMNINYSKLDVNTDPY
jgi:hypothetical protein